MPSLIFHVLALLVVAYLIGAAAAWIIIRTMYDPIDPDGDGSAAASKQQGAAQR